MEIDIWTKVERHGDKVLHTLYTRNPSSAKAMMVAPKLLEVLQLLVTARSDSEFDADMVRLCYEKAAAVIKEAIE